MMLHKKSRSSSLLKLLALLPIVGITLALNARTVTDYVYDEPQKQQPIKKGKKAGTINMGGQQVKVVEQSTAEGTFTPDEQKTAEGTFTPASEDEDVFDVVEKMPEFPGGMQALLDYLMKNVKYPKEAEDAKTQGRVIATFVVNKDGAIRNAKIVRSVDPALDNEALRVINAMPNWTPGRQNDKAVNVKYTIPISFMLQAKEKKEDAAQASNPDEAKAEGILVCGKAVLFIVDGETVSFEDFKTIDPKNIKHMDVLKDKSAIEKYGEKAKDGVIIVTTKQ